ncbi:hypothetical protein F4780DRAFT_716112 [Xylariomycetidae sp. FL0641]|nr:hypothetical protein F4780DRAFT_716112 [Xylariomycetidae sp. FL0641]
MSIVAAYPKTNPNKRCRPVEMQKAKYKTYNTGDSLVVTDPTTDPAVSGLSMGERTGPRVLQILWSYVLDNGLNLPSIARSHVPSNLWLGRPRMLECAPAGLHGIRTRSRTPRSRKVSTCAPSTHQNPWSSRSHLSMLPVDLLVFSKDAPEEDKAEERLQRNPKRQPDRNPLYLQVCRGACVLRAPAPASRAETQTGSAFSGRGDTSPAKVTGRSRLISRQGRLVGGRSLEKIFDSSTSCVRLMVPRFSPETSKADRQASCGCLPDYAQSR